MFCIWCTLVSFCEDQIYCFNMSPPAGLWNYPQTLDIEIGHPAMAMFQTLDVKMALIEHKQQKILLFQIARLKKCHFEQVRLKVLHYVSCVYKHGHVLLSFMLWSFNQWGGWIYWYNLSELRRVWNWTIESDVSAWHVIVFIAGCILVQKFWCALAWW